MIIFEKLYDVKTVKNYRKIRVGSKHDGGYVMLYDFANIELALSGGVGGNDKWERHIALKKKVIAYDILDNNFSNLTYEFKNERLTNLDAVTSNFPNNSLIGKFDIEGDEFELFSNSSISSLKKFRQLICEFHIQSLELTEKQCLTFDKLLNIFQTIHIHGNNYSNQIFKWNNLTIPSAFEVTFASKDYYDFEPFVGSLPSSLDSPCDPKIEDIKIF